MYEQSAQWNEYYREDAPKVRRRMLDERCMLDADDGANEFRQWLYAARYVDERQPGREVDRFLFQCVNFVQLYKSARMFRRSAAGEVRRNLSAMGFDRAGQYGEAGERALYWELRNAASRYFKTCESPSYRRAVFGLMSAGANRAELMARDAWEMSLGLSRRVRMEAEMGVWNRAVLDSLRAADPGADARIATLERADSERR